MKLFATEESVAKQERRQGQRRGSETELRVRVFFFSFLFVFAQGALNLKE